MKKFILFLAPTILSGCIRLSVTPATEGKIIDESTSLPVANAVITVVHYKNTNWTTSTTSDLSGYFKAEPAKTWTQIPFDPAIWIKGNMTVEKDGYQTINQPVEPMKQFEYKKADVGILKLRQKQNHRLHSITATSGSE